MSLIIENNVNKLKLTLCQLFKCETYGFGGIADPEGIKKDLYGAMTYALAAYYRDVMGVNKSAIDKFVSVNAEYKNKSIETLVAEKGEEGVIKLFKEFDELLKMIDIEQKYLAGMF